MILNCHPALRRTDTVATGAVDIPSAQVEEVGYPKEGDHTAVPSKEEKEGWARSLKKDHGLAPFAVLKEIKGR